MRLSMVSNGGYVMDVTYVTNVIYVTYVTDVGEVAHVVFRAESMARVSAEGSGAVSSAPETATPVMSV